MPCSVLQAGEQVQDLALDRDVEPGGRLVGDDQPGRQRERAGDADAARLAARELVRVAPEEVRAEADHREQAPRLGRQIARARAVDAQRLGDQRADGEARAERGDRVLEHHRELPPVGPERPVRQARAARCPSKRTAPACAGTSPMIARPSVVLPEPLSPTSAKVVARPSASDTSSTAAT